MNRAIFADLPICTSYFAEIVLLRDLKDYSYIMWKSGRQRPFDMQGRERLEKCHSIIA